MILGFKQRFVQPILSGEKIHTIRGDIHGRWKPGKDIHFATGIRTKKYHQFKFDTCKSTQEIQIRYGPPQYFSGMDIFIDGKILSVAQINQLACNDGFDCIWDFQKWFNKNFTGKIIHWTDLRY